MDKLLAQKNIPAITELVQNIYTHYGALDHKLNFTQNLRSSADFVYKHSISVAILSAMIANEMHIEPEDSQSLIAASLLYDFGYLSVPKSILDKIKFEKIRIYGQIANVFTLTGYSGLDPQVRTDTDGRSNDRTMGTDFGSYGMPRQFIMGVNVTF